MRGAIPPLPQYVFMARCLVKHRGNFTLLFTLWARQTYQLSTYRNIQNINEWIIKKRVDIKPPTTDSITMGFVQVNRKSWSMFMEQTCPHAKSQVIAPYHLHLWSILWQSVARSLGTVKMNLHVTKPKQASLNYTQPSENRNIWF
jgi:hypothetical protein